MPIFTSVSRIDVEESYVGLYERNNNSCQITRCVQEDLQELSTKSHLVDEGDSESEDDEPSISPDGSFKVRFLKEYVQSCLGVVHSYVILASPNL